jgi:hypothetical protein
MLWAICAILLILWLLHVAFHLISWVSGGLVHLLLIGAVIFAVVEILKRRR